MKNRIIVKLSHQDCVHKFFPVFPRLLSEGVNEKVMGRGTMHLMRKKWAKNCGKKKGETRREKFQKIQETCEYNLQNMEEI